MKKIFLSIGWVVVCSIGAYSQDPGTELTYKEAISIALKNNVTLNQQKNILLSREVQRNQSIAAMAPNVFIQGQGLNNKGQQQNPENGNLEDLTIKRFTTSINAQMTLFNGLNGLNTFQQNSELFRAQTSFMKRAEQDVVFNVTNQFLQVILDQELYRISQENFQAQKALLEQLQENVRLGVRAESELYNQDAQAKNMEVTSLRAKATLENDKAILAQTLQLDPSIPFSVSIESIQLRENYDINNLSLDSLYDIALNSREDLKQITYQVNANRFAYKAAANTYLPTVNLFASYGSNYYSNLTNQPIYGNFENQFLNVFPNLTYGFNFTIPIFSRLQGRSNRVQSKVTYDNSVLQKVNLEKTIKLDVKRSYNNYLVAIDSYKGGLAQLRAGELALTTQTESFRLGVANQVTLAQANQTYVQAAASKAQAEVTLLFQRILLEYALGTLNINEIVN